MALSEDAEMPDIADSELSRVPLKTAECEASPGMDSTPGTRGISPKLRLLALAASLGLIAAFAYASIFARQPDSGVGTQGVEAEGADALLVKAEAMGVDYGVDHGFKIVDGVSPTRTNILKIWNDMLRKHNITHDRMDQAHRKMLHLQNASLRKLQMDDADPTDEYAGYPTQCVINSFIAVFKLMQAGDFLAQSIMNTCNYDKKKNELDCAVSAQGAVSSLVASGAFLSAIAATCPPAGNKNAACSADVMATVASVTGAAQAFTAIDEACHDREDIASVGGVVEPDGDKVSPSNAVWCTVDVGTGLFSLAQAIDLIYMAAKDCPPDASGPPFESSGKLCAADVMGVVSAFSNAVSYLAMIGAHCAATAKRSKFFDMEGAECTATVAGSVGSLVGAAQAGLLASNDCSGTTEEPAPEPTPAPAP